MRRRRSFACRRNKTFLCPTANPHNPKDRTSHLYIVLTNPSEGGEVVAVNISTTRDDSLRSEWECLLKPGDHPFIRHTSYVVYKGARIEAAKQIERKCARRIYRPHRDIGDAVLEKICRGLLQSKRTPLRIKEFYEINRNRRRPPPTPATQPAGKQK